jgi:hypothetical protein
VGRGSSRGPRPPRHPRAPPPIRTTSITSPQRRRVQPLFGPLAQPKLEGEGATEAPPASQAAYALHTPIPRSRHTPTTTAVRFSYPALRGGGGKGEQSRSISLPGCPSRSAACRATVAPPIVATLLSPPSEEKRGMGRRELSRPQAFQAAPPHSTIQHLHRPEVIALATKPPPPEPEGGRGKEEQPRSLGLPGCPRGATTATPPSRCTAADRPPSTAAGPLRRVHTTSTAGSGHLSPCAAAEGRWAH